MNIKEIENFVESTESLSNYIEELGEAYKELDMLSSESYNSTVLQEKYLNVLNVYNNARGAIGLKPDSITHEAFSRSPYMSLAVTKEGIFSAIGDFFKKIWEWIKKIFKSIKEFLFGSSEDKAEEAKEEAEDVKKLIEKLRNRDLKDREFILEDLDKNSLLIKGKNNYGPLGIMFKRAEYNISYKVVADDIRKFLEDMEGFFKFADKEYGGLEDIAKDSKGTFGKDIVRTCHYAYLVYENYNYKLRNFKLYEKFDKFQDCLEEDFKNDPVVSDLESSFIVSNGREEFVIGKNARAHLTYLTADTAWKLYTIDTTDEHKKFVKSIEHIFAERADVLAADIDSGTSRHLAETEKGSGDYVIKSVHSALAFSNRSMLRPVKGYKLKSKEIDALKSYVTNKENLLNFLKVYSDFLMTIDVKSYTEVGNRIDRISKLVDKTMDSILKKHSAKQHGAVTKLLSETARNNDRTYEYFKYLANVVKNKVGDLAKFSMILKNEISIFSSDLKFDNISKLISSLFKEGSESVSSESYIRENVAPKLSFGNTRNLGTTAIEQEPSQADGETDFKKKFDRKVVREFFGLFGDKDDDDKKKYKILCNVDFEETVKSKDVKKYYDTGEELKDFFYPGSVFNEELIEILDRNMSGFLEYSDEDDNAYKRLVNGVDWIKNCGEPHRTATALKNMKTTDNFVELKVVNKKDYDEDFNIESCIKAVEYYKDNACLKEVRKDIEKCENGDGDKRFTPLLKEFLKIAEKCLDDMLACLYKYKEVIKVEVIEEGESRESFTQNPNNEIKVEPTKPEVKKVTLDFSKILR